MSTLKQSKDVVLKLLDEKIDDGKSNLIKCQNIRNATDYDSLVDDHEIWWASVGNLLRQLFADETISTNFLHVGFFTVDMNATLQHSIQNFKNIIEKEINKIELIKKDVSNNVYSFENITNRKKSNTKIRTARIVLWQAVLIALITGGASIFCTWLALPTKPATALDKQGLGNLSIEGKWLYICTDYEGKYQHGGRFKVNKQGDETLKLTGERMWKDIYNTEKRKWDNKNFTDNEILPWKSIWIYIHDENQFNMEYEIVSGNNLTKGYCTGSITEENGEVQKIDGHFYQLLPQTPLLAGRIIFYKVNDNSYHNPYWKKDH